MASRRVLMTVNNTYTQPLKNGLNRRLVFSMSTNYHSILLSKRYRKKNPDILNIIEKISTLRQYCEYLDLTKADE